MAGRKEGASKGGKTAGKGRKKKEQPGGKVSPQAKAKEKEKRKKRARDQLGKSVGMSGRTAEKLDAVIVADPPCYPTMSLQVERQ